MIKHYLKVAFRNMWKYRSQTLVSIIGLATGFACFAMATLWIRYEMTYDSFHKNVERIYCVYSGDIFSPAWTGRNSIPSPFAGYLKSTFPEIANAVAITPEYSEFEYENVKYKFDLLRVDSSFFDMFDVRIVEGSMDFMIHDNNKIAVTREKALQLFGNESPVGKKLYINENKDNCVEICAAVTGFSKRSNYPFDFLCGIKTDFTDNSCQHGHILVEAVPGADMKAFEKKLNEYAFQDRRFDIENMTLIPLTAIHYKDPNIERTVQFQHTVIFAVAGLLLILCTLFNCLTLFVSRFRIRRREFALRTVYGASGRSLFAMLSVEFLLSLSAALVLGLALINILSSSFLTVSGIRLDLPAIYLESGIYIAGIILVALAVFFLTLMIFRRHTLSANITGGNRKILRKTSIVVQLIISIVFAFCTLVILKQMYYLHSTDMGFSLKNRGSVYVSTEQTDVLHDKMKQIPEIQETVVTDFPLLPISSILHFRVSEWEGKHADADPVTVEYLRISERYAEFYTFELIEGEFVRDDDDKKYVLINESAAKTFGWDKPVGKSFDKFVVKGVIKNIYSFSPTIAAKPYYYSHQSDVIASRSGTTVLFRYADGRRKTCMEKINKIIEKEFPGTYYACHNMEDEYDKYLKSENTLLAILTVVSSVCVIICVFGFVSMVSLTCEERRKEIAIRKINGATVKDILDIFFKEYLTLLVAGALVAFPAGYLIMKRWLENYVIQTEMSAWVYLSILLALITVIVMCVGGRVYRTSRENPIEAIK